MMTKNKNRKKRSDGCRSSSWNDNENSLLLKQRYAGCQYARKGGCFHLGYRHCCAMTVSTRSFCFALRTRKRRRRGRRRGVFPATRRAKSRG
jgi:hypothetical protein